MLPQLRNDEVCVEGAQKPADDVLDGDDHKHMQTVVIENVAQLIGSTRENLTPTPQKMNRSLRDRD